ncbi:hypothetical protein BO94DRAFT_24231 [Aspergillus sclerotioniger CBS 115572]|uniref:Uncharacterized protein n=1 Tax=Aspergillus sclerotioniger CBS 115572 TaxID=1450535 RepID=A0A317WYS2_9EURO|nr:hypothetical protein BO94DRAFT_24231 [Aspergillus sclerotioniger CBS 115572]PWY90417.1 hypothetical protein BO94DRAFT_24231 [Aspergillus sclerotioniger CBS 115572]
MEIPQANDDISPAFHPLAVGEPDEQSQPPQEVSAVLSLLSDAGIHHCFIQQYAQIYYGSSIVQHDRVLCIQDEQFEQAVETLTSHSDILSPCGPNPLRSPSQLNHKYPRFKAIGWATFWLLVPGEYCHLDVKPENIEFSKGGLPYPKLAVYVQSAIDSRDDGLLQELIDGMDLTEEWGEEALDLGGQTDTKWLEDRFQAFVGDGVDPMFIWIDTTPVSRRKIWTEMVRNKQKRLGWKYPPEIYATRYRKHGAKDPRSVYRPGV